MLLWDYVNSIWRAPRCDANGRSDIIVEKGFITPVKASGATQFALSGDTENTTELIHTVNGGVTFHLVAWTAQGMNESGGADEHKLYITNAANDIQYYLVWWFIPTSAQKSTSGCFPIPLEIPTGWKIKAEVGVGGAHLRTFIHGYEV